MAKEKRTKSEVFGDTLLDLGKLTFGGIVLAGIFNSNADKVLLIILGVLFWMGFVLAGMYFITKK